MSPAVASPAEDLARAIEELSLATREAMLEAVRCPATQLIAGSYVAPGGGVCPLLAAHRRGGRSHDPSTTTSAFADVWDRCTSTGTGEARLIDASERQMLESLLVASLARERLRREAAERREREARAAIVGVRAGRGTRLETLLNAEGDRNRAQELARRAGWAWLGVYRRYDQYRSAVAHALVAEPQQVRGAPVGRREAELVA